MFTPSFSRYLRLGLCLVFCAYFASHNQLPAQEARYELGRRLKRFEQRWELADQNARARSTTWMEKAVSSFFSLQLQEAGKSLDLATHSLDQTDPVDAATAWALSRRLQVEPLFADSSMKELMLTVKDFYAVEGVAAEVLAKGKIRFSLYPLAAGSKYALNVDRSVPPILQSELLEIASLQTGWEWSDFKVPEGDYSLVAKVSIDGREIELSAAIISRVEQLDSRMAKLLDSAEAMRKSREYSTGVATIRSHLSLLENVRDGLVQETDYPVARLLLDAEQLIAADGNAGQLLDDQFAGDTWLTLASGRRTANVRLRVPPKKLDTFPVLFLFHGAGGSENMFFETYGAGRAVELAAERGWIVVAPRQRLLGGIGLSCSEMVEELSRYFPIDRNRIMFCGHSMGAMQATQQAVQTAWLPAAVVALGGGGRLSNGELGSAPWFVAAGDRDFGKGGAKALADSLSAKGKMVQWKEYSDTEHMVIVQAALDDVFRFLDVVASSPANTP